MFLKIFVLLCGLAAGWNVAASNADEVISLEQMLRRASQDHAIECAIRGAIEARQFSHTPLINLLIRLHIVGYRKGIIHSTHLNPILTLKAWEEREGLALYDYIISTYPDSLSIRYSPEGDSYPIGAWEFFRQLRKDWERAGGKMHANWTTRRVNSETQNKRAIQDFLLEIVFRSGAEPKENRRSAPMRPRPMVFDPESENSISNDVGLICLAFGGDTDAAPLNFSAAYTKYFYSHTSGGMPRADYLKAKREGLVQQAVDIQQKLHEAGFSFSVMPPKPLTAFRIATSQAESNFRTIKERLKKLDYATLPLTVFVAEGTGSGADQTEQKIESVARYGKLSEFVENFNAAAGEQVFTKPANLTWEQELFAQSQALLLLQNRKARAFRTFILQDPGQTVVLKEGDVAIRKQVYLSMWANKGGPMRSVNALSVEVNRLLGEILPPESAPF